MAIPGDFGVNRLILQQWPVGEPDLAFFVRPAGNDNNSGLTALTAFATLARALREQDLSEVNRTIPIDITGMTINLEELVQLGGWNLGHIKFDIDFSATSPNNFFSRHCRQIRSALVLDTALVVTGQAFDPITGLITLTVTNALVADELKGLFAVGSVLGEYGVIAGNTGGAGPNTVSVANQVGLTAPVGAYATGATLQLGDSANFFDQSCYLNALCDWTLQGINITHNDGKVAAITSWPHAPVAFTLCQINGINVHGGAGVVSIDGCYVTGIFAQDGATCSVTQSVFDGVSFLCHGSGASGLNEWIGSIFLACSPFGGGNLESRYSFFITGCHFREPTSHGIQALFGTSRLVDVIVDDAVNSGVYVDQQCTLFMDNVQGTGNGDFGCEAYFGSFVRNFNGTAITGAGGDIVVGALGVQLWGAVPLTDLDQLVRAGAT